jgi:hypothetical protein
VANEFLARKGLMALGPITSTSLTSGRIPLISTGGLIIDSSSFTWSGSNLSVAGNISTATLTVTGLTSTRIPYVTTGGLLTDNAKFWLNTTSGTGLNIVARASSEHSHINLYDESSSAYFTIMKRGSAATGNMSLAAGSAEIQTNVDVGMVFGSTSKYFAIGSGSAYWHKFTNTSLHIQGAQDNTGTNSNTVGHSLKINSALHFREKGGSSNGITGTTYASQMYLGTGSGWLEIFTVDTTYGVTLGVGAAEKLRIANAGITAYVPFLATTTYSAINTGQIVSLHTSAFSSSYGLRIGADSNHVILQGAENTNTAPVYINKFGGNFYVGTSSSLVGMNGITAPQGALHVNSTIALGSTSASQIMYIGHSEAGSTSSWISNSFASANATLAIRMGGNTSSNDVFRFFGDMTINVYSGTMVWKNSGSYLRFNYVTNTNNPNDLIMPYYQGGYYKFVDHTTASKGFAVDISNNYFWHYGYVGINTAPSTSWMLNVAGNTRLGFDRLSNTAVYGTMTIGEGGTGTGQTSLTVKSTGTGGSVNFQVLDTSNNVLLSTNENGYINIGATYIRHATSGGTIRFLNNGVALDSYVFNIGVNNSGSTYNGITVTGAGGTLGGGGAVVNYIKISPTFDWTIGGTITVRGFYYNPTLTNLAATTLTHYAFESTAGDILFSKAGSSGANPITVTIHANNPGGNLQSNPMLVFKHTSNTLGAHDVAYVEAYDTPGTASRLSVWLRNNSAGVMKKYWSFKDDGSLVSEYDTNLAEQGIFFDSGKVGGKKYIRIDTQEATGWGGEDLEIRAGHSQSGATGGNNYGGNVFIFGGDSVGGTNDGKVILAHNGTSAKGKVLIGTATSAGTHALQVSGHMYLPDTNYIYIGSEIIAGLDGSGYYLASGGTPYARPIHLGAAANTYLRINPNRVVFGGTDASKPSLKVSGAHLQVRLADDSALTSIQALTFIGDLTGNAATATNSTNWNNQQYAGTNWTSNFNFMTAQLGVWGYSTAAQVASAIQTAGSFIDGSGLAGNIPVWSDSNTLTYYTNFTYNGAAGDLNVVNNITTGNAFIGGYAILEDFVSVEIKGNYIRYHSNPNFTGDVYLGFSGANDSNWGLYNNTAGDWVFQTDVNSGNLNITFFGDVGVDTTPVSGGSDGKWLAFDGTSYSGGNIFKQSGVIKAYSYITSGGRFLQELVSGIEFGVQIAGSNKFLITGSAASFADTVTAPTFIGALTGTATNASSVYGIPYGGSNSSATPVYVWGYDGTNNVIYNSTGIRAFLGLTSAITGSGTVNYIPMFTGTGATIGNSSMFENTTELYISKRIYQEGSQDSWFTTVIRNNNNHVSAGARLIVNAYGNSWGIGMGSALMNSNKLTFRVDALGGTDVEKMSLDTSGNLEVVGWVKSSNTIYSNSNLTEGAGYQLNSVTMGYNSSLSEGWITAGGAASRTTLALNKGGGLVTVGGGGMTVSGTLNMVADIKLDDAFKIGWRYSSGDANMYNYITNSYSEGSLKYYSGSWTGSQGIVAHDFFTWTGSAWASKFSIYQNGKVTIQNITAHVPDSTDLSLDLTALEGGSSGEVSIRFHQSNRWFFQLRTTSSGFKFTEGNSGILASVRGNFIGDLTGTASNATTWNSRVYNTSGYTSPDYFMTSEDGTTFSYSSVASVQTTLGLTTGSWVDVPSTQTVTGLKTFSSGIIASSFINTLGAVSTVPVSTAGWRRVAYFEAAHGHRGGGEIFISYAGNAWTPTTTKIRYYKDWVSTAYLHVEHMGGVTHFTDVRIIQDSVDSVYYIECYFTSQTGADGFGHQMYVTHNKLMGYNSSAFVYTGALPAGTTSGTVFAFNTLQPISVGGTSNYSKHTFASEYLDAGSTYAPIEIREYKRGGAQSETQAYAPRLAFHWKDRYEGQISFYGGYFSMRNAANSGYVDMRAHNIVAEGGYIYGIGTQEIVRTDDEYLRFNQAGHYANGIYTPYVLRVDGFFRGGSKAIIGYNGDATPLSTLHLTGDSNMSAALTFSYSPTAYKNTITNNFSSGSAFDNFMSFSVCNTGSTTTSTPLTLFGNNTAMFYGNVTYGSDVLISSNASWGVSGSSTGALIIRLPDTVPQVAMLTMEIETYDYSSESGTTYIISGYRYNDGLWYNCSVRTMGGAPKPVRFASFGNTSTGYHAILIGNDNSSWYYGACRVIRAWTSPLYASNVTWSINGITITQSAAAVSSATWTSGAYSSSYITTEAVVAGYVPYSGAYTNVALGSYFLSAAHIRANEYCNSAGNTMLAYNSSPQHVNIYSGLGGFQVVSNNGSTALINVSNTGYSTFYGPITLDGAGRVINFDDDDAVIQRAGITKLTLASSLATISTALTVSSDITTTSGNIYGQSTSSYINLNNTVGAKIGYSTYFTTWDSAAIGMYTAGTNRMVINTTYVGSALPLIVGNFGTPLGTIHASGNNGNATIALSYNATDYRSYITATFDSSSAINNRLSFSVCTSGTTASSEVLRLTGDGNGILYGRIAINTPDVTATAITTKSVTSQGALRIIESDTTAYWIQHAAGSKMYHTRNGLGDHYLTFYNNGDEGRVMILRDTEINSNYSVHIGGHNTILRHDGYHTDLADHNHLLIESSAGGQLSLSGMDGGGRVQAQNAIGSIGTLGINVLGGNVEIGDTSSDTSIPGTMHVDKELVLNDGEYNKVLQVGHNAGSNLTIIDQEFIYTDAFGFVVEILYVEPNSKASTYIIHRGIVDNDENITLDTPAVFDAPLGGANYSAEAFSYSGGKFIMIADLGEDMNIRVKLKFLYY